MVNVQHLETNTHFKLISHDVTLPLGLKVGAIYNLASPASPIHYQKDPIQTLKTNVLGSLNMLELARKLQAPIFQASTSEVYGDPAVHPQVEEYWGNVNPIGPRACYDEGKRAAETLFFDYHRQHGVPIRVARIFNTYGPRLASGDGRVVSNFLVQALSGENITIYGDGSQTRSFCYVSDLVDGFVRMMEHKDARLGPVNIGNPSEISMLGLAELVINVTKSNSKIIFVSLPEDDPKQRKPDISRAKSLLGWQPKIDLTEGLDHTMKYFKSFG
jgi:UDP-glucuronate decarboxylase